MLGGAIRQFPGELGRQHLEARALQQELEGSGYRDCFEFETRFAARPLDLLRELRKLKPTVVHFSGHGTQNGLYFEAAHGCAQLVSTAALEETFGAAGDSVKLVVLNACYSEPQAEALLAHVGLAGSFVNANLHYHTLVPEGVWHEQPDGSVAFHPLPPPTDEDVEVLAVRIVRRVARLVEGGVGVATHGVLSSVHRWRACVVPTPPPAACSVKTSPSARAVAIGLACSHSSRTPSILGMADGASRTWRGTCGSGRSTGSRSL